MKKNIVKSVEKVLSKENSKKKALATFEQAANQYEKLLSQGLTSKRGHNIMTTGEIYSSFLNCQVKK